VQQGVNARRAGSSLLSTRRPEW